MYRTKFRFIGQNAFRGELFQKSTNQKKEWPVAAMFVNGSRRNEHSLQKTCHRCFLLSFGSLDQAVLEEKIFKNLQIRKKICLWRPCLLMVRDKISNLQRGPTIDASYQVSLHLAEGFQRRRLKCEKLTDDGRQVMAKSSHYLWQGELKIHQIDSNRINRSYIKLTIRQVNELPLSLYLSIF